MLGCFRLFAEIMHASHVGGIDDLDLQLTVASSAIRRGNGLSLDVLARNGNPLPILGGCKVPHRQGLRADKDLVKRIGLKRELADGAIICAGHKEGILLVLSFSFRGRGAWRTNRSGYGGLRVSGIVDIDRLILGAGFVNTDGVVAANTDDALAVGRVAQERGTGSV